MIIDTHCHLDYIAAGLHGHDPTQPIEAVLERAHQYGVMSLINPCVHPADFDRVIALAERFENVFAAVAIHPCDVESTKHYPHWLASMEAYATHPKVVALGETGLDYYHQTAEESQLQRDCFEQTLRLAEVYNLPVIVHDRDAHDDVARIIDSVPSQRPKHRGVMHCFGGDAPFAQAMTERGFYISFAGNVTFKKADTLREAAKATPLEYLLIETDSPFLSPMPERGKPNEPYRTRFVANCIAEVKKLPVEAIIEATTANAERLFSRLPQTSR
jgi:TatD DNase family protein